MTFSCVGIDTRRQIHLPRYSYISTIAGTSYRFKIEAGDTRYIFHQTGTRYSYLHSAVLYIIQYNIHYNQLNTIVRGSRISVPCVVNCDGCEAESGPNWFADRRARSAGYNIAHNIKLYALSITIQYIIVYTQYCLLFNTIQIRMYLILVVLMNTLTCYVVCTDCTDSGVLAYSRREVGIKGINSPYRLYIICKSFC